MVQGVIKRDNVDSIGPSIFEMVDLIIEQLFHLNNLRLCGREI